MSLNRSQGLLTRVDGQGRLKVLIKYSIDQHRQAGDMVEVRVGQKNMANRIKILKLKITDTGARIDEHIVVD
jgi:hypothetical protein